MTAVHDACDIYKKSDVRVYNFLTQGESSCQGESHFCPLPVGWVTRGLCRAVHGHSVKCTVVQCTL